MEREGGSGLDEHGEGERLCERARLAEILDAEREP
jgi:hypothetical protein